MGMDAVFVYFLLQSDIARGVTAGFWVLMFNVSVAIKQYNQGAGFFGVVRALSGSELLFRYSPASVQAPEF